MATKPKGPRPDAARDVAIYKEYRKPGTVATHLAERKGISRSGLYRIVSRVEETKPAVKLAMDKKYGELTKK